MPATSETLTYNSQLVRTLQHRSSGYVDAITKQSALMYWLKDKKRYVSTTGQRIEIPVMYRLNTQEASFSGLDLISLNEQDPLTNLLIGWKHYLIPIVLNGQELEVFNTGPEKRIDYLKSLEDHALSSMYEALNVDLFDDGTGNSSKVVTGLEAICSETPTSGTLYGVNRATAGNEWHRNQKKDNGSGGAAVAAYSSGTPPTWTMLRGMEQLYQECSRLRHGGMGQKTPDLILCSEGYERTYADSTRNVGQRFVNAKMGNAGFNTYQFKNATMVSDQDCPNDTTNSGGGVKAFFINSNYIELRYAKNRNFKVTDLVQVANQDAKVSHLVWSGELVSSLCAKHGCHIGIIGI